MTKNLDRCNFVKIAYLIDIIEEKTVNNFVYELLSDNTKDCWEKGKKIDLRIIEEGITISKKSSNF
jgi:hypothetical protein